MKFLLHAASCLCLVAVPALLAQQTEAQQAVVQSNGAPPPATGSVTGTVLAQDTQRAIRLAQVSLQNVESVAGANGTRQGFRQAGGFGGFGQARTDADGTFTATNLAPGDYYVTAQAVGYIPERSVLLGAVAGGADPAQLLAGLPVVHVTADTTSNVTVTLQRGGALSGRVVWEDGSPAAGLSVTALPAPVNGVTPSTQLPAPLSGLQLNGFTGTAQTDDRGDFRISGLPTGDYNVETVIQSGGRFGPGRGGQVPSSVRVFAPNTFHRSAAKAYSVRTGDERSDVRLVLDLRGLHSVTGHVSSSDAGLKVASGFVTVVDSNDKALQLQGSIDAEGDFTVRYVPPGNYSLSIGGASTRSANFIGRRETESSPAVNFQPFSQAIVVTDTDLTGFAATLTPSQTAPR